LAAFGVDPTKKTIALGVGSTNSRAKRWPAERYAALNDRLQTDLDANVILVGSKAETDVADRVAGLCAKQPINLTGKTDLAEVVATLSVIDLLISNDMGLAHVAPAVGTRTIVIIGPTLPETTRPFSDNAEIVQKRVECSGCMLRDCPIDHRCMTGISVEQVFEAAERHLNAKSQSSEDAKEDNLLVG
jgi:heptosyltransferase-2